MAVGTSLTADIRRELQALLSRERELIHRADGAMAGRAYGALRDLADELVSLAGRQAALRLALAEAQAQASRREPKQERAWSAPYPGMSPRPEPLLGRQEPDEAHDADPEGR